MEDRGDNNNIESLGKGSSAPLWPNRATEEMCDCFSVFTVSALYAFYIFFRGYLSKFLLLGTFSISYLQVKTTYSDSV